MGGWVDVCACGCVGVISHTNMACTYISSTFRQQISNSPQQTGKVIRWHIQVVGATLL